MYHTVDEYRWHRYYRAPETLRKPFRNWSGVTSGVIRSSSVFVNAFAVLLFCVCGFFVCLFVFWGGVVCFLFVCFQFRPINVVQGKTEGKRMVVLTSHCLPQAVALSYLCRVVFVLTHLWQRESSRSGGKSGPGTPRHQGTDFCLTWGGWSPHK